MNHTILLLDDNPTVLKAMKDFLEDEGFFVKAVHDAGEAVALVRQKIYDFSLGLVDFHLQGGLKGSAVIREIREINSRIPLIGFSVDGEDEPHNESLDHGAISFVHKDGSTSKLLAVLHRTCREVERMRKPLPPIPDSENTKVIEQVGAGMIGVSDHQAEVARLVLLYAKSNHGVLIRGENGTGKEIIARAVHMHSGRRGKFIAVNCGGMTEALIEANLFGHEKGSFTGATASRVGKFQAADHGTIFLDEIGELPLSLQASLLRVLQEKEVVPVGANVGEKVDFRVIAATNSPLEEKIKRGEFRLDLINRLDVLRINIKPLRERPQDIPALANAFMERENIAQGVSRVITESCVRELQKLPWPGNVRELEHAIKRMHLMAQGAEVNEDSLNAIAPLTEVSGKQVRLMNHDILLHRFKRDEVELIELSLELSRNLNEAAGRISMTRSHLRSRMKALKINNPFREKEGDEI